MQYNDYNINNDYIYVKSFYPLQDNGFFPNDDWFHHKYSLSEFLETFQLSDYLLSSWISFYNKMINTISEQKLKYLYVMCPTYWVKENDELPDFQIQVSGKLCNDETPEEAISRELGEELGILPNRLSCIKSTNDEHVKMINYIDCNPVRNNKNVYKEEEYGQVICYVYINRTDITSYLKMKVVRLYDPNEIDLRFVSLIPINVLNYIINEYLNPQEVKEDVIDIDNVINDFINDYDVDARYDPENTIQDQNLEQDYYSF